MAQPGGGGSVPLPPAILNLLQGSKAPPPSSQPRGGGGAAAPDGMASQGQGQEGDLRDVLGGLGGPSDLAAGRSAPGGRGARPDGFGPGSSSLSAMGDGHSRGAHRRIRSRGDPGGSDFARRIHTRPTSGECSREQPRVIIAIWLAVCRRRSVVVVQGGSGRIVCGAVEQAGLGLGLPIADPANQREQLCWLFLVPHALTLDAASTG